MLYNCVAPKFLGSSLGFSQYNGWRERTVCLCGRDYTEGEEQLPLLPPDPGPQGYAHERITIPMLLPEALKGKFK